MCFHRKTHAELLLAGFPKPEKLHSLEPSGTVSWILVVVDMVELSHLGLLTLSSWGFPLEMWIFLPLLWIPNSLSLPINLAPSIPKWLVIDCYIPMLRLCLHASHSSLENECLKSFFLDLKIHPKEGLNIKA